MKELTYKELKLINGGGGLTEVGEFVYKAAGYLIGAWAHGMTHYRQGVRGNYEHC